MQNRPNILKEISLDSLIIQLLIKQQDVEKQYPRAPISFDDYQFAKNIIEGCYLTGLRADNFCIDISKINIESWTKEQYRAFAKLFIKFSDKASDLLQMKQDNKQDISKEVQLIWIKLPKQKNDNCKVVNGINKILLNHGYEDSTGNENAITLSKYINSKRKNPITPYSRITKSITLVIVTENDTVLLLKRGGLGGRAGTWGTLTGKIEQEDGSKETALIREVHEEINILLENYPVHYVGSVHTHNLSKDKVEKG